jgi:hypothetical protein
MSGLSGSDVDFVLEKLKVAIDQARYDCQTTSAMELEDIASAIKRLREESTTQASRPDRVGDECWFRTGGDWQKGILRVWDVGCEHSMAIVEDKETGVAKPTINISFSAEAPK